MSRFHGGPYFSPMKYIFVTGGVVSSLGKGLTAAALGALLELRGLTVRIQKFDPYLNVDPGTMSPFQHRERMPWRVGRSKSQFAQICYGGLT